jgi:hypothetical protein
LKVEKKIHRYELRLTQDWLHPTKENDFAVPKATLILYGKVTPRVNNPYMEKGPNLYLLSVVRGFAGVRGRKNTELNTGQHYRQNQK